VPLALACNACTSTYTLTRQSIPAADQPSKPLHAEVAAPGGWRTSGPGKDDIAFQPTDCQRPYCPIISVVLYVGDPYDPVPTQADTAKRWWNQIDRNVVIEAVGAFFAPTHGMLTIYHFSSPNIDEQLIVFVIHNQETVAVSLSNFPKGNFQPYVGALKDVATSVHFVNG
jgi:hypothetical protein